MSPSPSLYDPESLIGQTIQQYRLETLLGMGGSGAVFLGRSTDGQTVAIKILVPPILINATQREEFRKRFLREAETLNRLHHPHILPIYSFGKDEHIGCVYMVMPLMSGGTLADCIQPEGLPFPFILSSIEHIADALDYAHEQNVIHRDLKPTNILLDENDSPYLSDFGIAKLFERNLTTLTQTNQALGTPGYMAPEQITNQPISPATDVYGLAIITYQLVTGQLPFNVSSLLSALQQIMLTQPPDPQQLRADLSHEAKEVILRGLAKTPEERFTSAGSFALALGQSLTSISDLPLREQHIPTAISLSNNYTGNLPTLPSRHFSDNLSSQETIHTTTASAQSVSSLHDDFSMSSFPQKNATRGPDPQPILLPVSQVQSKPSAFLSKPLSPHTSAEMIGKISTQKPDSVPPMRRGDSHTPQFVASRPSSRPVQQGKGPASPNNATGLRPRQPVGTNRTHRSRGQRLYLILGSVAVLLIVLFSLVYLNITSTVKLTVTTQNYSHPVTLTLSSTGQPNTVPATVITHTFTKTGSEPVTGTKMQATNYATGVVNFTDTGTMALQIPSQTVIASPNNIDFVTTANVLLEPQSQNTAPLPVPIQASVLGVLGNLPAGSISVIPDASLISLAQVQVTPITTAKLKSTLTVSNPDATSGGEATTVAAITQQDLDNAKKDLHQQLLADIDTWMQQSAKNGLAAQPITTDTLVSPPSVNQAEPNKIFSASIHVVATILIARLSDVQKATANLLNSAVQADKQFGPTFAIIGDPQTIKIDQVQLGGSDNNRVIVNATGQVGPSLNTNDVQKSISGKTFDQAQAILRQKNQQIKTVDIRTQPGFFPWISPWTDHITIIMVPAQ